MILFLRIGSSFWVIATSSITSNQAYLAYFYVKLNQYPIPLSLALDWISLTFSGTVCIITSRVYMFSQFYISQEKFKVRFKLILSIFVIRIIVLISSGNLMTLILGWDGLGLRSYLLVVFFNRKKSNNAGLLTALTNRIGDVAIIISIAIIINQYSWSFLLNNYPIFLRDPYLPTLLILARFTKRAQTPFSSWLPAAIAAPTPVSALVHSSTLVTAGVYLLIRLAPLFHSSAMRNALALNGSLTLFMARIRALRETDLKKIVALSTLSQLGLIITIIGINQPLVAFFHLNTHAFFKSLLFISSGDLIHNSGGWQDTRQIDYSSTMLTSNQKIIFLSNFSLMGRPFISGFFSKDLFLEIRSVHMSTTIMILFLYSSLAITILYTMRFLNLGIFANHKTKIINRNQDLRGTHPGYTIILLILSIMRGGVLTEIVFPSTNFVFIPAFIKSLPLLIYFISIITLWRFRNTTKLKKRGITNLLFLDKFITNYTSLIVIVTTPLLSKKNELKFFNFHSLSTRLIYSTPFYMKWTSGKIRVSSLSFTVTIVGLLLV